MDTRREKFEAWVVGAYGWPIEVIKSARLARGYAGLQLQRDWEAWNAALDSMEIELPRARLTYPAHEASSDQDYYFDGAHDDALYACRRALEAAGLKVKP